MPHTRVILIGNGKVAAYPGWLDVPGLLHGTTVRAALPAAGKFDLFAAIAQLRSAGVLPQRLTIGADQVHGEKIAVVAGPIAFGGHPAGFRWNAEAQIGEFAETDALVTSIPGVILAIRTADCLPILFVDRPAKIVAAAHCGWKGTLAGLAAKTAAAMIELGARPSRIEAWIGPSIRACHYEVGVDLVGQFQKKFPGIQLSENGRQLDLAAAARAQLEAAGLLPEHIFDSEECTMEKPELFHSHRADAQNAGRMISFVSLGPDENA